MHVCVQLCVFVHVCVCVCVCCVCIHVYIVCAHAVCVHSVIAFFSASFVSFWDRSDLSVLSPIPQWGSFLVKGEFWNGVLMFITLAFCLLRETPHFLLTDTWWWTSWLCLQGVTTSRVTSIPQPLLWFSRSPRKGGSCLATRATWQWVSFIPTYYVCVDVDVYITCTTLSLSLSLFLSVFVCLSLHDCDVWGGMAQWNFVFMSEMKWDGSVMCL